MEKGLQSPRIPFSQRPGLEDHLENAEGHVITKGGLCSQEVGPINWVQALGRTG